MDINLALARAIDEDIADALQGTTVDAMIVGHTHRISNLLRGRILVVEGINAGTSYSVLQLMVQDGDVAWVMTIAGERAAAAGDATRARRAFELSRDQWKGLSRPDKVVEVERTLRSLR